MKQIVLVTAEVLKQIMNGGIVYENKEEIDICSQGGRKAERTV